MSRKKNAKPRLPEKKKSPMISFFASIIKVVGVLNVILKVANKILELIKNIGDWI